MKAFWKGERFLQPPRVGETSCSSEFIEPSSLDREGEFGQVHEGVAGGEIQLIKDDNVSTSPLSICVRVGAQGSHVMD